MLLLLVTSLLLGVIASIALLFWTKPIIYSHSGQCIPSGKLGNTSFLCYSYDKGFPVIALQGNSGFGADKTLPNYVAVIANPKIKTSGFVADAAIWSAVAYIVLSAGAMLVAPKSKR